MGAFSGLGNDSKWKQVEASHFLVQFENIVSSIMTKDDIVKSIFNENLQSSEVYCEREDSLKREIPAQAATVATISLALTSIPQNHRQSLSSSSEELSSIYGRTSRVQVVEELEEEFYEEV